LILRNRAAFKEVREVSEARERSGKDHVQETSTCPIKLLLTHSLFHSASH
jgi:hypothetical protein